MLTAAPPEVAPALPRPPAWRGPWGRRGLVAAVCLAAACVAVFRIPTGALDHPYAEDGAVFVPAALGHPWRALVTPYQGYLHLLPRLTATTVVHLLPAPWWGIGMTVAACVLVGLGAGAVFHFSGAVVASVPARLGLAGIMVLSPLADVEPLGSVANLHWFAGFVMLWLLLAQPRARRAALGTAVLAAVLTLTEPQCALLAPLAVWVWLRREGARPIVVGWGVGLLCQVAAFLAAPRSRYGELPSFASAANGFALNAGLSNFSTSPHLVGHLVAATDWALAWLAVAFFLLCGLYAARRGGPAIRALVTTCVLASAASWFLSVYVNGVHGAFYTDLHHPPLLLRWGTTASMLLAACLPLAAAALAARGAAGSRRRWTTAGAAAAVGALLVVMSLSWFGPYHYRSGPSWSTAVAGKQAVCTQHPDRLARMPLSPPGWAVLIPCRDLS